MKKLLIVTGGSGGHVAPSVSLFEHLKENYSVKIVTDQRGKKFIDKKKYDYEVINVPNLFLKPYLLPIYVIKYFYNIFKSYKFIKKFGIEIVISTGGYMSLPFCIAAFILKKKIFLFEPNSVLGKSNKIALNFSNKIICYHKNLKNFPTKYDFKKIIIKPILKSQLYNLKKNSTKFDKKISKILIIGGSQGASFFDHKITELMIKISKKHKIEIVQQIANKNLNLSIQEKYNKEKIKHAFFQFSDDYSKIYEKVDLAITRGGAGTLSELSFLRIPFVSIPLPTAKDNHQFYNSIYYYENNCSWILEQKNFEIIETSNFILKILNNYNDYEIKINNLKDLTEKNTWNNINNHIIEIINEN